jgi:transposase-like protein
MTSAGKAGADGAGAHPVRPPLKRNARGRLCVTRRQREGLLAEYDQSGLSAARFAKAAGINEQTFAGWLKARRSRAAARPAQAAPAGAVTWVEAALSPPPAEPDLEKGTAAAALRVHLPGGAWMEPAAAGQVRTAALLLRELSVSGGGAPC